MVIEVLEKIDRARVMVYQLNYGEREWKLSHPPREDDPDMVIHEALRSAALEISRLSRELEEARERERRLREAVLDTIRKACRCEEYYRAIEREDPQCQAHDIEYYVEQVFEASG